MSCPLPGAKVGKVEIMLSSLYAGMVVLLFLLFMGVLKGRF